MGEWEIYQYLLTNGNVVIKLLIFPYAGFQFSSAFDIFQNFFGTDNPFGKCGINKVYQVVL